MTPDSTADIDALTAAIARHRPRRRLPPQEGRVQAAVCVPLQVGPGGLEVWTIKRSDRMRHHPAEIAFPGGTPDPGDRDPADTALREMEEELGVGREELRVLGRLPACPTATSHFTVNPFVVHVAGDVVPTLQVAEVAVLIRTPIDDFFDGRVPQQAVELGEGRRSPIFVFQVGSMFGASAHVMEDLLLVYGALHGRELPEPEITDRIPWA
jgi:8-oxo-dGTP pyrophosphatase MutT (NUDIX family)